MKIATSTVSRNGFGNPAYFEANLQALRKLLAEAKGKGVQLVCLPGGYFSVNSEAQLNEAANRIVAEARKEKIAVAVGIDCVDGQNANKKNKGGTDIDSLVRKEKLPSFAVAWTPQQGKIEKWRQRSTTSKNQSFAPAKSCARPQALRVAGKRIEILMCGDLFNKLIRKAVRDRQPTALVDLSHVGQGFRPDHALRSLAQEGLYAFCCTHANAKGAMKRAYAPGGTKISSRAVDVLIAGLPRIELKFEDI